MKRRSFLAVLASIAPGLALARAGIGAPAALSGLDAWMPAFDAPVLLGVDRIACTGFMFAMNPGANATITLPVDWTEV